MLEVCETLAFLGIWDFNIGSYYSAPCSTVGCSIEVSVLFSQAWHHNMVQPPGFQQNDIYDMGAEATGVGLGGHVLHYDCTRNMGSLTTIMVLYKLPLHIPVQAECRSLNACRRIPGSKQSCRCAYLKVFPTIRGPGTHPIEEGFFARIATKKTRNL